MAREKACKNCRRLVTGDECPVCKSRDLTTKWKGLAVVLDIDSKIAEELGIGTPGRYAIKIR